MSDPLEYSAGAIYYVRDEHLGLPGESQGRTVHANRRPVVVVSDQQNMHGRNALPHRQWPSVLVIPISSSTRLVTLFDVKLAAGEGNLSKKGWARIPALQPLDKTYLGDFLGVISSEKLNEITNQILYYLGLIAPE